MPTSKELLVLSGITAATIAASRRQIMPNLRLSAKRWREDPAKQLGKIAVSTATGQGIFWTVGYDQLGVLMDTKIQLGLGRHVAAAIYERLPKSSAAAWTIKVIEIAADASKIPVEGALLRRYGIVPDGVAALITQPLWSLIETAEKAAGAVAHPERVAQPEAVMVSLGCIYGTLVRHAASGLIFLVGEALITARQQG